MIESRAHRADLRLLDEATADRLMHDEHGRWSDLQSIGNGLTLMMRDR